MIILNVHRVAVGVATMCLSYMKYNKNANFVQFLLTPIIYNDRVLL